MTVTSTRTAAPPPPVLLEACPIARALDVLGEKWTILVLRDLFRGVRRFDDLQRSLGAPRAVLTARLATLVEHGVVERVPYREPGARERHEYVLTDAGRDLAPVVVAISDWGTRHTPAPDGWLLEHRDCGSRVHAQVVCEDGHPLASPRELRLRTV